MMVHCNDNGYSLSQWLNFKLSGITCLVGRIKFKLFDLVEVPKTPCTYATLIQKVFCSINVQNCQIHQLCSLGKLPKLVKPTVRHTPLVS